TKIDRALRVAHGDAVATLHGRRNGLDAYGLVVPFDEVAHQISLNQRRVNPVYPRSPFAGVHGAGAAHDQDRRAVTPGVVDRHGSMLQADDVVHNRGHRLAGSLGITVRDRDGDFFVTAEDNLRIRLTAALVIYQRIVNTAKARTGIQSDIFDAQNFQQIDDEIRSITCGHKTSNKNSTPSYISPVAGERREGLKF